MDLDRFIAAHQSHWQRLDALARQAGRGVDRMPAGELMELVSLYRRTSTHLSYARTYFRDPALVTQLTHLLGRAGAVVYGTRPRNLRAVGRFFAETFPAALWRLRWYVAVAAAVFLIPAVATGAWFGSSAVALDAAIPPDLQTAIVTEDFAAYYRDTQAAQFATEVGLNNIQVGVLAFAGGILLTVPTLLLLVFNGLNVGQAAGLFVAFDQQPVFWGLILPHGLLELTAVFVAGGAGLLLGWTVVDPGDRWRIDALAEEGRRAMVIVLGLVVVFGLAAVIEAFVTGSDLPTWARVGIGLLAEGAFLGYAGVLGRSATRRGVTGSLGEADRAAWAVAQAATAGRRP